MVLMIFVSINLIYLHLFPTFMDMTAQCVHCVLRRIQFETEMVDPARTMKIMEACLKETARGFGPGVNSAATATRVHKLAYDMLGTDPYIRLKEHSTRVSQALFPRAKEYVDGADDKFRASVITAIIGNVLDFGINQKLDDLSYLEREFDQLLEEELGIDDINAIQERLASARKVAFLTDNCGEIVFDKLLVEQIRKFNNIEELVLVVKGEPILTDATPEDAEEIGLARMFDRMITTEAFAVGLPIYDMPEELDRVLEEADIIISKGMGNFESLTHTDYKPVAYLMRTKCWPVAEAAGAPLDRNVAKLVIK